jgi:hypothetical protein
MFVSPLFDSAIDSKLRACDLVLRMSFSVASKRFATA